MAKKPFPPKKGGKKESKKEEAMEQKKGKGKFVPFKKKKY